MKAGILAMWLKRKYGVPYVVTEHWAIYNDYAPDAFEKKSLVFKNFTRKILKEAAMFLPVSDDLGKAVIRMAIKVPYIVVPNVADTTLFNYETMHQRPFTFFHASTLGYQKNPGAILRAFKKFLRVNPQSRLVMAGYAGEWPGYANELGIPARNVEFTGFIPYVQVAMLMKQADVLVMFSRYENLPCVIIEALCCGLPVISSNVGGISEIVNQSNGMLVPAGNEDTLLQALIQMYMNRQQYNRAYIAQNAAALYAYSVIGQQVAGIYQSVIDKNITLVGNKH
jgi:glycosyltransferase involved in cell wall biosynthesis